MSRERKLKEQVARRLAKQDYDGALESCIELVKVAPDDDRNHLKLGELQERVGKKREALATYKELVERYAEDGRLVRAVAVARRILDLDPSDTRMQKRLALLYAARGLPAPSAARSAARVQAHAAAHAPVEADAAPAKEDAAPEPPAETPAPGAPPPPPDDALEQAGWQPGGSTRLIDALAAEEDPFASSADEEKRRQLAADDLASLDLGDLDLAFVELAPAAVPAAPPTPLFSDLAPEELAAVLNEVTVRRLTDGEVVVRQGDVGDSVFVVSDGELRVRVTKIDGSDIEVAHLGEGDFFGEFGMFTDGRRQATVVAAGEVELLEIRHEDLVAVARSHPRVKQVLIDFYRKRAIDTALAASKLFGDLPPDARGPLASMVAEERHQAGSTVLQEGDDGEGVYLVRSGRLVVESKGLGDDPVRLATLGPGDFFGEVSVVSGSPVTADVVAEGPVEVLKLSRTEILHLCKFYPAIRERLEAASQRRLHESIDRLTESGLV